MKRWLTVVLLMIPLPFAVLPLIAVGLQQPGGGPEASVVVLQSTADQPLAQPAAIEPTSLGMRVAESDQPCHLDQLPIEG